MKKKLLIIIAIIVVSGCVSQKSDEITQPEFKGIQRNGTAWLQYGPAVINSCKRVDISSDLDEEKYFVIITDNPLLEKIKDWTRKNYGYQMNYSEINPFYETCYFNETITLYSSTQGGEEAILLFIPLGREDINELKLLCKGIKNRKR